MPKEKILLIEDNQDDISLIQRAFFKTKLNEKFELIIIQDGIEALFYFKNNDSRSNTLKEKNLKLILLDLKLPKVDGFEILQKIRNNEKTKLIPVVIFTSSKEEFDINKSYLLGANSYIRKPIDSKKFNSVIHQIVTYWGNINELSAFT